MSFFTPFSFIKTTAAASVSPVPTTNLALWLDANDSASYPGSGATWYDIATGTADNMTLNGSFSYESSPYKNINMTSSGIYGNTTNISGLSGNWTGSYVFVYYPTAVDLFTGTVSLGYTGGQCWSNFRFSGADSIDVWQNGDGGVRVKTSVKTGPANNWQLIAWRKTSGGALTVNNLTISYGSGSLGHYTGADLEVTRTSNNTPNLASQLGNGLIQSGYEALYRQPAKFGAQLVYNRVLSDAEVNQIYTYYK